MRRLRVALAGILVGLLGGLEATPAWGDERHYVVIFGAQPSPKVIRYAHTWATFVRVVGDEADPATCQLFAHTISFYPADLDVRPFALRAEPGVNLDLAATLALMRQNRANVTAWGPFLMRPEVYQKSVEVWSQFGSGAIDYRAIDTFNKDVDDCIHAVTAVDPDYGRGHYPLIRVGKSASRYIAHQVAKSGRPRPPVLPDQTWLIAALGLYRPERRGRLAEPVLPTAGTARVYAPSDCRRPICYLGSLGMSNCREHEGSNDERIDAGFGS